MKPSDPLTVEEMKAASEQFFPLFDVILSNMPENSKIEDCLKVMESVAQLAQKKRVEDKLTAPFGFNKKKDEETTDDSSTPSYGGTAEGGSAPTLHFC